MTDQNFALDEAIDDWHRQHPVRSAFQRFISLIKNMWRDSEVPF